MSETQKNVSKKTVSNKDAIDRPMTATEAVLVVGMFVFMTGSVAFAAYEGVCRVAEDLCRAENTLRSAQPFGSTPTMLPSPKPFKK